ITSHGGYRSSGQVWVFMAQALTSPAHEQFVTLKKTPEALTAVCHATGGRVHAVTTTPARRRSPAGSRRRAATGRRSGREDMQRPDTVNWASPMPLLQGQAPGASNAAMAAVVRGKRFVNGIRSLENRRLT